MTMDTGQRLVDDYLARLERAARVLPPEQRAELVAEIREHIESARTADEISSEVGVRALLDRIGRPEEIVAASGASPAASPEPRASRSLTLEIWAVVMLTAGSLLPVVGWLVGVVLLWSSNRWRLREKVLGTLLVPGGIGGLLILGFGWVGVSSCFTSYEGTVVVANTCDDHPVADVVRPVLAVLLLLAALVVPLVLLQLARRRANAETQSPLRGLAEQPVSTP